MRAAAGRRLAPLRRGAPVAPGFDPRGARVLDLSTLTDALAPGAWRDPAAIAAAVEAEGGVAVGRHGEGRIVHDRGAGLEEPATVHLGVDLFLPAGTPVLAPLAGTVLARGPRELVIAAGRRPRAPARGDGAAR